MAERTDIPRGRKPRVDSDADDEVETGVQTSRVDQVQQSPGAGAVVQDSEEVKVLRKAGQKSKPVLSKTNEPAAKNTRRRRPPRMVWVLGLLSVLLGKISFEGRLFEVPNTHTKEAPKETHMAVLRARTCVLNTDTHTRTHSHIFVRACECLCI